MQVKQPIKLHHERKGQHMSQEEVASEFPGLQSILPPRSKLELNEDARTLHLFTIDDVGQPSIIAQSQFSTNEWRVLIPILHAYPGYASYTTLLAALTGVSLTVAQQRIDDFRKTRTSRQELRAIRDALSNISEKIAAFGFAYASIYERGYTLALLSPQGDEEIRDSTSSPVM